MVRSLPVAVHAASAVLATAKDEHMVELTQAEFEAVEVKIAEARKAFLEGLSKHRELSRLWSELA